MGKMIKLVLIMVIVLIFTGCMQSIPESCELERLEMLESAWLSMVQSVLEKLADVEEVEVTLVSAVDSYWVVGINVSMEQGRALTEEIKSAIARIVETSTVGFAVVENIRAEVLENAI